MQTTLVVTVVVAGIAFVLWKLKHHLVDEDRPEIVVRNGTFRIKTAKDWKKLSSAKKWKPDHPNGKSVAEYEVTVKNANEAQCDNTTLTGDHVKIVFEVNSGRETLRIVRERSGGKHEPVVDSDIDLEHETNDSKALRIKLDPEASIKKVKVGNNTECTFPRVPGDPVVVKVNIKH